MSGNDQSHSFPKRERLRRRREYLAVSREGIRISARYFILVILSRSDSAVRIGITASRKVGPAVVRNRIKRLTREFYRLHKELFPPGDYSIIARSNAADQCSSTIFEDLSRVVRKLQAQHG